VQNYNKLRKCEFKQDRILKDYKSELNKYTKVNYLNIQM